MKSVLITGAGGFIGSHLVELCVQHGFKTKALVHYNSLNSWGWLDHSPINKDVEILQGDIRDYDSVENASKNTDTIFHLAALIGIPYSYTSPKAYIDTNITGTYNVLQACRSNDIEQVIMTSTSETYGSAQYTPIDEHHPLVGQSPYSASKIGADQLALSYHKSFNLPVKIARPFNTYGPRQSARAFIPTVLSQIINGHDNKVRLGSLDTTRDLTFVEDTVEGFLEIAKTPNLEGSVTNIGMNEEISMQDLCALIQSITGTNLDIDKEPDRVRPLASEVQRLKCNNSKIKEYTQWNPKHSLKTGLKKTYHWLHENIHHYKPNIYNI